MKAGADSQNISALMLALPAVVVSLVAYFAWSRGGAFYKWWKAGAKNWNYVVSFVLLTADVILAVQLKAEPHWSGYAALTIISSFLAKDYAQHFTVNCGARPRRKNASCQIVVSTSTPSPCQLIG